MTVLAMGRLFATNSESTIRSVNSSVFVIHLKKFISKKKKKDVWKGGLSACLLKNVFVI